MKTKQWLFFSALGAIAIVLLLLIVFLFKVEVPGIPKRQKHDSLTIKELPLIHEGDVILRRGFGHVSSSIVNLLKEEYPVSHCGIVVQDSTGHLFVIHAVSSGISGIDGVQSCSVENFCREAMQNTLMVSRCKNANPRKTGERARSFLRQQLPFDNEFDFKDDTQLYCNEMVWKSLWGTGDSAVVNFAKYNELEQKKFCYFWDKDQFEVVVNHFDRKKK